MDNLAIVKKHLIRQFALGYCEATRPLNAEELVNDYVSKMLEEFHEDAKSLLEEINAKSNKSASQETSKSANKTTSQII